MSSDAVGVQAQIKREAPLSTHVHCNGHCLNLVASKGCSLPQEILANNCMLLDACYNSPNVSCLVAIAAVHEFYLDDTNNKSCMLSIVLNNGLKFKSAWVKFGKAIFYLIKINTKAMVNVKKSKI